MKSFQIKTRVNFGDNALDRLAEVPYKKILIVTDPFMAKSKNLNLILNRWIRNNILKDIIFLTCFFDWIENQVQIFAFRHKWVFNDQDLLIWHFCQSIK